MKRTRVMSQPRREPGPDLDAGNGPKLALVVYFRSASGTADQRAAGESSVGRAELRRVYIGKGQRIEGLVARSAGDGFCRVWEAANAVVVVCHVGRQAAALIRNIAASRVNAVSRIGCFGSEQESI